MFGFVKDFSVGRWLGLQGEPAAVPNQSGYTKTFGPYGETIECGTRQCVHCGGHVEIVKGSGRLRGTCYRCHDGKPGGGFVCGRFECMAGCVPFERRLENVEAGRPLLLPPEPKVFVTGEVPSD